jgi:integrase/recombinase XerD
MASTGLRASEACSLTMNDISFDERKIYVRKGKWGKARRVGITEGLLVALQEYIAWKGAMTPQPPLLINGVRKPLNRNGLYQRLKKLERRVAVEVTPHALRRAFVTINVANNIPLVYLQIACGHSDITTTRSYCQTTEEEVVEANMRFTSFSSY